MDEIILKMIEQIADQTEKLRMLINTQTRRIVEQSQLTDNNTTRIELANMAETYQDKISDISAKLDIIADKAGDASKIIWSRVDFVFYEDDLD